MSRFAAIAGLLLIATASVLHAQDADPLQAALSRPILSEGQPWAEVRAYCEARVPSLPAVTTREKWQRFADRNRADTLKKVVFRGEADRWRRGRTRVESLGTIEGGPGYRIRRLRYEALPGLWIPALLYEPEKLAGRVPVVLNVNGHDGNGKAAPYKQLRCINLAKRGMIALNPEWFGMGQLRTPGFQHGLINAVDLCGTSGISTHYLALKRGIDVLLAQEHADPSRVAVTGLSGGGWQTIFISSLDTRVTLTNPVAGYSSFKTRARYASDLGDSEQTPVDMATVTDYTHLTAMMAPRATLLTYNAKDDCCFRAEHALPPLLESASPIFKLYGREQRLRWHIDVDPGTHNYLVGNRQAFYRMVGDHFFAGNTAYNPTEIPSEVEVKSSDQLRVELPTDNLDLQKLALSLAKDLPRDARLPTDPRKAREWQRSRRTRLREIVRARDFTVRAETAGTETLAGRPVTRWRLRMDDAWTVPVVEIGARDAKETVLVIADGGRAAAVASVRQHLDAGRRVVAVDPFYLGESHPQPASLAYLWALFVGAVGDRPVGIQASQLRAVARWLRDERGAGAVTLAASGPRSSLAALVTAGLEEEAIGALELQGSLGSLKEVLEQGTPFAGGPEYFCFGLLERFDVPQLAALAAPRPVRFLAPSDRARRELAGLAAWYRTHGESVDPLGP